MLHKILTAVTALAVVASLLAGAAGQAAAVSGYDSAYFGESAFLTLGPGQSGQFAVGFNNTGSTGWLTGSASQVDLAVCQADKVTCNTTSPNAAFASTWLSSTAYATTSTTYVGPGQTGYFTYNITVPAGATTGLYRFNGDVALHGTASMIHQQGYYQDVDVPNVGAPAKLACTANPTSIEAGSSTTSTITVTVQDSAGSTVTSNNGQQILLQQSGGTSNGSLGGGAQGASQTLGTASGTATFTLNSGPGGGVFSGTTTGTDNLSATATGTQITGCSLNVTFTAAGAPTKLNESVFNPTGQLATTQYSYPAGQLSRPDVRARTKDVNSVTVPVTADTAVTATIDNGAVCNFGTSGASDPTVTTKTQTIPTGSTNTIFSQIFVTGVAGTCTITESATGLTSASQTLTVAAAGPASKLAITSNGCTSPNPTTAQNSSSTCDVVAQVQDASGNPVFVASNMLTLKLTPGTGNTTCSAQFNSTTPATVVTNTAPPYSTSNSTSAPTDATGKVTFTLQDGTAETCSATATGTAGATTLTQTGTTVTWTGTGVATKLGNTKATPTSIPANNISTSTLQVCVTDAGGNIVQSSDSIGINRTAGPGATVVTSANPTPAVSGCSQYTVRSVTGVTGTDTYTATDNTSPAITSTTVSVNTF